MENCRVEEDDKSLIEFFLKLIGNSLEESKQPTSRSTACARTCTLMRRKHVVDRPIDWPKDLKPEYYSGRSGSGPTREIYIRPIETVWASGLPTVDRYMEPVDRKSGSVQFEFVSYFCFWSGFRSEFGFPSIGCSSGYTTRVSEPQFEPWTLREVICIWEFQG